MAKGPEAVKKALEDEAAEDDAAADAEEAEAKNAKKLDTSTSVGYAAMFEAEMKNQMHAI